MSIQSATQRLIDEFRARPTLRAGSLITTVFGDAIAPRGGTVWIGSLIRCLEPFGASERLVRTSVFRLAKDGWLDVDQVGRRSYYRLTSDGARRFEQATHRIYGEPRQRWSGGWTLAILAGLDAGQKDTVRKELAWLGFGALSGNVMVHPSPDAADLDASLRALGPGLSLIVMDAKTRGDGQDLALRELAQNSWNLADLDARYARFVRRFRPVFSAAQKTRRLAPDTAFQVRTLLIQEYRKILLRDPLLPSELLPADWHGTPAYQLCRNLYRAVYAAADEYLGDAMETANGPLPPPEPRFYDRFGGLR
ncbi:MAG: phenylacetic acid degradation operon negative regulatory protein PaaX [Woeseiaceae bacterium]|nr:phenylacetic acid degradation operon negative regulatory protein PaaX [Woeseiaceae bacterium]